jgi:hypothetical protein
MKCPSCGLSVIGVLRNFSPRRKTADVEIHHHEDAKRWNLGAQTRVCRLRMSFRKSQKLMASL